MNLARVAIKQLTASDLSFFAPHLKRSKQKAINLNADVFVDRFYPNLSGRLEEFPFRLNIVGPGGRAPHVLTRKAIRTAGAKNWRLDGEIVHNPADQADRYDRLADGDFAVMAFEGDDNPKAVTLVLVSAAEDGDLYAVIRGAHDFQGRETMVAVDQEDLSALLTETSNAYADVHPLESLLTPDTVEEAVFGSAKEQERTGTTDGKGAAITAEALKLQLQAGEETGRRGEEAFDRWLESTGHTEDDYEWVSRTHARATHDFHVTNPRWDGAAGPQYLDVKATKGALDTPVHMSMAEVRWAATHDNYALVRVYDLGTDQPKFRMLTGVRVVAERIMHDVVPALPTGVAIDGFELAVANFQMGFAGEIPPLAP